MSTDKPVCIRCGREAEHAYEVPDLSGQGLPPILGYICEFLKPSPPRPVIVSPEVYERYMALTSEDPEPRSKSYLHLMSDWNGLWIHGPEEPSEDDK